jgi:hypothetical protein
MRRIAKGQWVMCPRRTLCAGAPVGAIGEHHAKLTEHVRLAVYYDSCTRDVQATVDPAPKAESPTCVKLSTSTFPFLHVVRELLKATETGAATAGEQTSSLSVHVCFGNKVLSMSRRRDDRMEIVVGRGEANAILELELLYDAKVQLHRQSREMGTRHRIKQRFEVARKCSARASKDRLSLLIVAQSFVGISYHAIR